KPVVLTLAKLLEMVSMLNCWDDMPEAAVHNERIIWESPPPVWGGRLASTGAAAGGAELPGPPVGSMTDVWGASVIQQPRGFRIAVRPPSAAHRRVGQASACFFQLLPVAVKPLITPGPNR